MKAKLLGIQEVNFADRQTGEVIRGVKTHIVYREADVVGEAVAVLWFSSSNAFFPVVAKAHIGCTLVLEYGPKNKLSDVYVQTDAASAPAAPAAAAQNTAAPAHPAAAPVAAAQNAAAPDAAQEQPAAQESSKNKNKIA